VKVLLILGFILAGDGYFLISDDGLDLAEMDAEIEKEVEKVDFAPKLITRKISSIKESIIEEGKPFEKMKKEEIIKAFNNFNNHKVAKKAFEPAPPPEPPPEPELTCSSQDSRLQNALSQC